MIKSTALGYENLIKAVLSLKNADECASFFDDICTIREIQDMGQRLDVALMLSDGKNYAEISEATGASSATISRVNKCLNYGSDGYSTVIKRLKAEEEAK